ncbi:MULTISPECIES: small multi-drug export protein [Bacillaceae]|uniref:Small multi-drug export protein n=1 Tax=Evansella alkalicola TaxID=745819 RepID=A0ABS6JXT8_9BACI|nr:MULTISPECIES: small multi-drug export protein [Bacillaceae]MBU9722911.1 small multi-drug export protein [Bacillus alkalicola]
MVIWETLWQYILIFVMAATPWLEILIVIPIGIAMGLNPLMVAIVSFLGNFFPILIIVYSLAWFKQTAWYKNFAKRKAAKKEKKARERELSQEQDPDNDSDIVVSESSKPNKKSKKERAAAIFEKYGLPGLAFLGPIITGIHLAAIIALSLKASKTRTTIWMGVSLVFWTVLLTIASFYGIDWITDLF